MFGGRLMRKLPFVPGSAASAVFVRISILFAAILSLSVIFRLAVLEAGVAEGMKV
ncbi:hypothetical protein D3C87_1407040 [compost metagenome]